MRLILLLLLFFGVGAPAASPLHPSQQEPDSATPYDAATVTDAIAKALRGEHQEFHMESHCLTGDGLRTVEIFSNREAIWTGRIQIELQAPQLKSILQLLEESGFAEMKDTYGGKNDPDPNRPPFASRISCRVEVTVDGVTKQSNQFLVGRQSEKLKKLAQSILEICEMSVGEGVTVKSLDDALAKLSDGVLVPGILRLVVNRKPDSEALEQGVPGWILTVTDGVATVRNYLAPRGMTDEVALRLSPGQVSALATVLMDERLTSLERNLYANHYTDLTVEILGHRKNIQARQFSGRNRDTPALQKKRLQRIVRAMTDLYEAVARDGKPVAY